MKAASVLFISMIVIIVFLGMVFINFIQFAAIFCTHPDILQYFTGQVHLNSLTVPVIIEYLQTKLPTASSCVRIL